MTFLWIISLHKEQSTTYNSNIIKFNSICIKLSNLTPILLHNYYKFCYDRKLVKQNKLQKLRNNCNSMYTTLCPINKLTAVTSSNHNLFWKFCHWQIFQKICNKVIILKIPTHLVHVATLPCKTQCLKTSDVLKLMSWLTINHKATHLSVVKFSIVTILQS